ncbi:MAG: 4Fe-4S binding protein [Rhodospirillaceae bacterium]|nr:4Fe-4S binding protein [Rhodospirillaceae bacterium]
MWYLPVLLKNLIEGPATESFPFSEPRTPATTRGRMSFSAEDCALCRMCARVCPAGAIQFGKVDGGQSFTLWHNSCVFCGLCAHYCDSKALKPIPDWHLSHTTDATYDMVEEGQVFAQKCGGCGRQKMPVSEALAHKLYPEIEDKAEIAALRTLCPSCRKSRLATRDAAA